MFESGDVVKVEGFSGVAFRVIGPETEPDEDTEWSGYEVETGRIECHMVGDDRIFTFEPDDLEPLEELAYCHVCGQIGCAHDGIDREDYYV